MLLPLVGDPAPLAHHAGSSGSPSSARVAFAAAFLFVPRRVAARAAADRARLLARRVEADLVRAVPLRRQAGGRRRALPGHPRRRARLDRPRRARPAPTWPSSGPSRSDRFTVNQNEFFNRGVGQVYYTVAPDARRRSAELPVAVDRRTGVVRLADGRAGPPRLPAHRRLGRAGRRSPSPATRALGMTVWKVNGPLVLAKTTTSRASTRTTRGRAPASPGRGSTAAAAR